MSDEMDYPAWRMTFPRKLLAMLNESIAVEHAALDRRVALKRATLEDSADPLEVANADDLDALQAFGDDYTDLHGRTEGLGKALVIVAVASLVETLMKMKVAQLGLTLPKRADWKDAKDALEKVSADALENFDGWAFASLARALANAFKHGDGFAPHGKDADLKKCLDARQKGPTCAREKETSSRSRCSLRRTARAEASRRAAREAWLSAGSPPCGLAARGLAGPARIIVVGCGVTGSRRIATAAAPRHGPGGAVRRTPGRRGS